MSTIWKYRLDFFEGGATEIWIETPGPSDSLLRIAYQGEFLTGWFLVDPAPGEDEKLSTEDIDTTPTRHHFRVFGTGWVVPDLGDMCHEETVQSPQGFVWHIWYEQVTG